jgi:LysR family transcriptional regulator, glycine cleavage system transcriptional activator
MPRNLPPLNALRAFEAAARNGSFTRAAEELCVTQGAVSQQVKALEIDLAVKLFHRAPGGLEMTEAGRDYLVTVRDALDRIALGTERLRQRQGSGKLTVSVSPDFAAKFLVHRLGRFSHEHPDISLRISADMHHVDFARENVDMAVRHGDGNWPGLEASRLAAEHLLAVCRPDLAASSKGRTLSPKDLSSWPLLHLDCCDTWAEWFKAAGVENADVSRGPVMNRAAMLIDAAINGQGLALARTLIAASDLLGRRLVQPVRFSVPLKLSYWIVCPKPSASQPKIKLFRDWLIAEAAEDLWRMKVLESGRPISPLPAPDIRSEALVSP